MRRFLCSLSLALAATTASADVELGAYQQYQTRFGPAQVTGEIYQQSLSVLGAALPVETDYRWTILGAYALAEADHDWLLATHHHGGNMCGPGITVIRVSEARVQPMGEAGGCEGALRDLRVYPEALELDIYRDGMRQQFTTYRFSDEGQLETPNELPFASGQPAGAGPEVQRWIGEHPYEIFRHADERARFLTIMTVEEIRDLSTRIGPANNVIQRGDWVLGAGCMAHSCNISGGVWGIRISDGAPAAALLDAGSPPVTYGAEAGDPVFRGWINEHSN